jgi:ParB family chromosome partitioning protein
MLINNRNSEVKEIPLDKIDIGLYQVRTSDVDEEIEELANSIKIIGLIEPILVFPKIGDRYEVVTGQRRFLAHEYLKLKTIRATVLSGELDPDYIKAISLTENMVRKNLTNKNYIDACTALHRKFGSIKKVSEMLGLPYYKVSQYVKHEQLIPTLKEKVSRGLKLEVALRAQKVATNTGSNEINEQAAVFYAEHMQRMSGVQQRELEKVVVQKENKNLPLEEVIKKTMKQQQRKIYIIIGDNLDRALQEFINDENTEEDNAIILLVESGLMDRGYL